jgi:hypothetical protein
LARDYLDVTHLVRCIQRAEGNPDCFRKIMEECQEINCCWRAYCVEGTQVTGTAEKAEGDRAHCLDDPGRETGVNPGSRRAEGNRP